LKFKDRAKEKIKALEEQLAMQKTINRDNKDKDTLRKTSSTLFAGVTSSTAYNNKKRMV